MAIEALIKQQFACHSVCRGETVQSLWSGYGEIVRFLLFDSQGEPWSIPSIIVKSIQAPAQLSHPRGWNSDDSHQRKLQSYVVEANFYQHWASLCSSKSQVPECFGVFDIEASPNEAAARYILLSDLDAAGLFERHDHLTPAQASICVHWLAEFHANFMLDSETEAGPKNAQPHWAQGLWPVGTYWHLATRMDEWQAMPDSSLKWAAQALADRLNLCRFKTLVHGDAKVANFCFSSQGDAVAAVDFQYVGGGCGMQDLVYFFGSCLSEGDCEAHYKALLTEYFAVLRLALVDSELDMAALEAEWRSLFDIAWADFQRFIVGWSPDHRKNNAFSQRITQRALKSLALA